MSKLESLKEKEKEKIIVVRYTFKPWKEKEVVSY